MPHDFSDADWGDAEQEVRSILDTEAVARAAAEQEIERYRQACLPVVPLIEELVLGFLRTTNPRFGELQPRYAPPAMYDNLPNAGQEIANGQVTVAARCLYEPPVAQPGVRPRFVGGSWTFAGFYNLADSIFCQFEVETEGSWRFYDYCWDERSSWGDTYLGRNAKTGEVTVTRYGGGRFMNDSDIPDYVGAAKRCMAALLIDAGLPLPSSD